MIKLTTSEEKAIKLKSAGFNTIKISEVLGVKKNTVHQLIWSAKKKLRYKESKNVA